MDVRLAGEVEPGPHVSVRTDDSLGTQRIKSVAQVTLLVNDRVVKVGLDLSQQWRADLLSNVHFVLNCDTVLLYTTIGG